MQILDHDTVLINPATGLIDEQIDALIDATDHAHGLGKQDALDGKRQDAFIFPANSAAWLAYHAGYREGSILAAFLTGQNKRYWLPTEPTVIQSVSWNTAPSNPTNGDYRCPRCGKYYDPTYGHQCASRVDDDYVPFQMPKEVDPTADMSEGDFMRHVLDQFGNGSEQPTVKLSDEALAAIEDEAIGAEFCRQPWGW